MLLNSFYVSTRQRCNGKKTILGKYLFTVVYSCMLSFVVGYMSCYKSFNNLQIIQRTFDFSFSSIGQMGINHCGFDDFIFLRLSISCANRMSVRKKNFLR